MLSATRYNGSDGVANTRAGYSKLAPNSPGMPRSTEVTTTPSDPPDDLLQTLRSASRALVAGHVTPDADSLGSALALTLALRRRGAAAQFILPQRRASRRLAFMLELAGEDAVRHDCPGPYSHVMIVDTAAPKRINAPISLDPVPGRTIVNVDHHLTNTRFGDVNWVDAGACSTSEMVFRLLRALDWPLTADMASLLYCGIHGDTGGFSLPTTTVNSLHAAAELVRAGADVGAIGERLCRSQAQGDFDLLRRVYDHTALTSDGQIAYSYLSHDDIVATGCCAEDIDDQVAVPRSLLGIRMAILFSEAEPGTVRINLRGEGGTSVLGLAQAFGGGGHAQSAGVRVRNKPMQQVIDEVLAEARRHLAH